MNKPVYIVNYLTAQSMGNLKLELFTGNESVILELYEFLYVLNFVIFLRLWIWLIVSKENQLNIYFTIHCASRIMHVQFRYSFLTFLLY
jgi:hypothetical protein